MIHGVELTWRIEHLTLGVGQLDQLADQATCPQLAGQSRLSSPVLQALCASGQPAPASVDIVAVPAQVVALSLITRRSIGIRCGIQVAHDHHHFL